jgi:hypothetical protein
VRRGGPVFAAVLVVTLAWLAWAALHPLFRVLAGLGATPSELTAVLGLVLGVALVGLLVFDLDHAVSILLLDPDLELLRRAPLAPRTLFAVKLADALPRTIAPLLVVGAPALLAFASVRPLTPGAWLMIPPLLACLWAIPLGFGTALAIQMLRRVPARRARASLGLLSTLTLTALWIANLVLLPRLARVAGDPLEMLRGWIATQPRAIAWSPAQWAAASLEGAGAGDPRALVRNGAPLALAAIAALAAAAWSATRHLGPVLAAVRTGRGPRARRGDRAPASPEPRRGGLAAEVLVRDARLYARDWTVLGDVLTAALLWTLLPLAGATLRSIEAPALVRAMLTTLSIGLGYEIASRSIPIERRGAAWMRLAPRPAARWVAAKLGSGAALALPLVFAAALSLGLASGFGAREWLETALAVLPALGLSLALGLWAGAAFGDPGWTHPRAMLTLTGRLVAAGLMVAQAVLWLLPTALAQAGEPPGAGGAWHLVPALVAAGLATLPLRAVASMISGRSRAGMVGVP